MELASMLAGGPFTDHPASVCPVIGSFLRAYNDSCDNDRRQDLYAYAAEVVDSAGSPAVQHARAARLIEWGREMRGRRWGRSSGWRWLNALRARLTQIDTIGIDAVRSIPLLTDEIHAAALGLIDELLAINVVQAAPVERVGAPEHVAFVDLVGGTHLW
jgi:hypothetical protein